MNQVYLLGNLGTDVDLRYTQSGKPVTNFRMATSKKFRNSQGEMQERVEWHRVACFGKIAETCAQYLNKGRQVLVDGELQTRQWTDRDGVTRYTTEIVAHSVKFLGGTRVDRNSQPEDQGDPGPQSSAGQPVDDDEIEF